MARVKLLFSGMNNVDEARNIDPKTGQCPEIVNCHIDGLDVVTLRDGFSLISEGPTSGLTAKTSEIAYAVRNGHIVSFDGTDLTYLFLTDDETADTPGPMADDCEFCEVNDIVVFSDNYKIGIIDSGGASLIASASDWFDVEDVESWIENHQNNKLEDDTSNIEVDAFSLGTFAGKCLTFYNGALYLAVGNFLFCTKTFNVSVMDIRYNIAGGFPDTITGVLPVDGGLFVGTTRSVYFLEGNGLVIDGNGQLASFFRARKVSAYPMLYGSGVQIQASILPFDQAQGRAVVWTSPDGIYAGMAGGQCVNLTKKTMRFPQATRATGYFRNGSATGDYHYLLCYDGSPLCFDTTGDSPAIRTENLLGTYDLDLTTLATCRYDRFPFNSFCRIGAYDYGANELGLFRLGGSVDFSGIPALQQDIPAHILTPDAAFGSGSLITIPDIWLVGRSDGDLAIDMLVDGVDELQDLEIAWIDRPGIHSMRCRLPRGIRGNRYQFRISNVSGMDFELHGMALDVLESKRR